MKSVLVIDTPNDCKTCRLRYDSYGINDICILTDDIVDEYYMSDTKPEWCPLSPLPPKKDLTHYVQRGDAKSMTHAMMLVHDYGYNDCLDDILKEKQIKIHEI